MGDTAPSYRPLHSAAMSVARTAFALARRAPLRAPIRRTFATSFVRKSDKWDPKPGDPEAKLLPFEGTFEDPIVVDSAGEELQCGCTGSPADSHLVRWVVVSRDRPYQRCDECGSVYKMRYVGPPDDPHDHHHHHGVSEPKTMADYVKEDYWYR